MYNNIIEHRKPHEIANENQLSYEVAAHIAAYIQAGKSACVWEGDYFTGDAIIELVRQYDKLQNKIGD